MPRHASRSLAVSSWVLLALVAGHDLTHAFDEGLRTPLDQLALVAVPQWLVLAATMAVILRADRGTSAAAALLLGAGATVGFAVVHLLPSAPAAYWELHPSVASWLLAWVPAVAGLVVAALAWMQRRAPARVPVASS